MTYRSRLGCGGRWHTANGSEEVVLSLGQGGAQLCELGLMNHRLDVTIVQHPYFLSRIVYSSLQYHRRGAERKIGGLG